MKSALLPCPYCGNKFLKIRDGHLIFVQCSKCGAHSESYVYEEEAIEAWNMREDLYEREDCRS